MSSRVKMVQPWATTPRKLLIVLREHRFRCRGMWAALKHLKGTRRPLELVLSNRCANTQMCKHVASGGPGARSRRPGTGFVTRTMSFVWKCAGQITLEVTSSAVLVKTEPVPRKEMLEPRHHCGPVSFIQPALA